ncbi:MAG: SIMPL domain-containing protein, partial [Solirubrobacterales bacterium]|nr:SIMPL domain-containing protein [Solirubrobacterales bacterium]
DRSTVGVTVQEEFDYDHDGRHSLGHRATTSVALRLVDASLIGRLVSSASDAVGASVNGPEWRISASNPVRREAARAAAADARDKAAAYASGVDAQLGALLYLAEPADPRFRRGQAEMVARAAAGGAPEMEIEPGELEVKAAIDATFTLEPLG